jgi:hypothetical protein
MEYTEFKLWEAGNFHYLSIIFSDLHISNYNSQNHPFYIIMDEAVGAILISNVILLIPS